MFSHHHVCAVQRFDSHKDFDARDLNIENKDNIYRLCDILALQISDAHKTCLKAQRLLRKSSQQIPVSQRIFDNIGHEIQYLNFLMSGGLVLAGLPTQLDCLINNFLNFVTDKSEQEQMLLTIEYFQTELNNLQKNIELLEVQAKKAAQVLNLSFESKPYCWD